MAPILPPDHKSIPSGIEDLKDAAPKVTYTGVVLVTLYQPGPQVVQPYAVVQAIEQPRQADDPPRDNYSFAVSYSRERGVQSTASGMPFSQGDWPIPQRRSSSAHLMMSSTHPALLFGSTTSSDMPPFNGNWPMPRRQMGLHPSQMMFSTNAALTLTYITTPKTTDNSDFPRT